MCSIGGFVSEKPISKDTAIRLASSILYYGADRGEQSTGIYVNGRLLKRAIAPDEFIMLDEFENLFPEKVTQCLLHTRQPTSGGLGDPQAQPFKLGQTVTVHNGWFLNTDEIKQQWEIQKKSGVDSELVTQFIHSYGVKKLPKFVESVYGSSAFGILYQGDLYLMRDGNPTAYTVIDLINDNYVFIFASTGRILSNSIRHVWLLPNNHPIRETKDGILFKVKKGNIKKLSDRVYSSVDYPSFTYGYDHRFLPSVRKFGTESVDPDIRFFKPRHFASSKESEIQEIMNYGFSREDAMELANIKAEEENGKSRI